MKPTIRDLKAYVPAKDFELSKRFYATEVASDPAFHAVRVAAIEVVGDSRVLHVVDPSGVLLIFVG